jgi:hypothetical protein
MGTPYKYGNISLKNGTYSKLQYLSEVIVPGEPLSKARTVEKLIDSALSNSENNNKRITNATDTTEDKQIV